jgi:hypothetical protein
MNDAYAQVIGAVLSGTAKAREFLSPMIIAESAVSLLEEAVEQSLGLLSDRPGVLGAYGLDAAKRVPHSAESRVRQGVDTARWLGRLLSGSLQLGVEIVKSTNPRSQ